ncbi:MAG: peptidoglycan-binding protein [Treponema sp.]|nr:peptidoglycan-binding protein [Treponema sp.]
MNCSKIIDMVYGCCENDHRNDSSLPLFAQIQIGFHTLFCSECAKKIEMYENARNILSEDFFPSPSVSFENPIMARIKAEEKSTESEEAFAAPGGISTRSWVIAGIILAVSLVIAFFSLDYQNLSEKIGISFILPMGITIGSILTTYGALFIGSHLKELSIRFGIGGEDPLNEELGITN